ncbi:MAG: hypothetical protein NVS2B12_20050 [Ktedonobacteraceae bacterium]
MLLVLFFSACGATATDTRPAQSAPTLAATLPPARYSVAIQREVAYGPLSAEKLDICRPEKAAGARPGVILVHGGGWTGGSKETLLGPCRLLAQQGFVAATVDYRLAQTGLPGTQWPAQLVDVQLVVRWLRSQSTQLNLDPQRLGAWGSSAGGHLAVFLGSLKTIHSGDQAQLLANQSPTVSWVVDEFGPTNLTAYDSKVLDHNFAALFGGSYQQNPAAYRDASPLFAINSQSASTLIIQGAQDGTVPPNQSGALQQALQKNNVPVQYLSYQGGHTFHDLTRQQRATITAQELTFLIGSEHP